MLNHEHICLNYYVIVLGFVLRRKRQSELEKKPDNVNQIPVPA